MLDSLRIQLINHKTDDDKRARLLLNLAFYSQPDEGLRHAKEALNVSKTIGNREYEAISWEYIGTKNMFLGNHLESVNSLITASQIYNEIGLTDKEALIYLTLGSCCTSNYDYINGFKYLNKCLPLFYDQGDSSRIAVAYLNIGESYRKMNQPDSAVLFFEKALNIYNSIDDISKKYLVVGNLGMVHSSQEKYEMAKYEIGSAIEKFREEKNYYLLSVFQSEMADIYIKEGKNKEGEALMIHSLEIAKEAKLKEQIRDISLMLSEFYVKEDNFKAALFLYKQYKAYDDSLKDVENVRKMEQQQSRFELTKKEEEIESLNRINRLQKWLSYGLSAGVVVFILFTFFLFRVNALVRKTNDKLSEQKIIIEKREQEKALLLKELNHRVKNNLQMVASLLNLQARQLKGHPAADALLSGKLRVEALTLIHQKLYRDDIDTTINIGSYIEELSKNLVMNFGQEFQLKLQLEPFVVNIDKAIPLGLIVNELITNSLKYGSEQNQFPLLSILLKNENGEMEISISDNGKGLPPGFDWKQSKSFGLKLVYSLINQLDGNIDYIYVNGSKWTINIKSEKLV
ncbi:MAG: tetratricopeptide repeat protein [Prolixibacteraceae bacterium]|nr:tetratricopeptide repeat protein [Prolixibacteraceae bacterium]